MPNHTSNVLEINGDKKQLADFIAAVKTKESDFDFNGVVPMPDEIRDTDKGWSADETPAEKEAKEKKNKELKAKYGASDWYDWSVNNWGTKWNAYEIGEWDVQSNKKIAAITYQTAWSPATEFFLNASVKFPKLSFKHSFADEGGGFLGWQEIKNGEIIASEDLDWYSKAGIQFRDREIGYYYSDEEYEIKGRLEYLEEHPEDGSPEEIAELKETLDSMEKD